MRVSVFFLTVLGLSCLAASVPAQDRFDACTLITQAEIQAVQGQQVTQTKSSQPARKGFAISQCFYTLSPFEKSVSLEVTRPLSHSASSPPEDWKRLFHAEKNSHLEPSRAASKQAKAGKPRRVRGIGDEAFWVGDPIAGVLYVLRGDAYFRISVGGWANEKQRVQKTETLARKAVKRL